MDTILLRTLTRKSKLGFGKYADMPIQQIFDYNDKMYLRYIYLNLEGITFTDDILREIPIYENERIIKPGKNPEMTIIKDFELDGFKKYVYNKTTKHRQKAKYTSYRKSTNKQYFKKGILQAKNQGH